MDAVCPVFVQHLGNSRGGLSVDEVRHEDDDPVPVHGVVLVKGSLQTLADIGERGWFWNWNT